MWEVKAHGNEWIIVANGNANFTRGSWKDRETAQAWADHFNARRY